jgi:hypothetical protein
MFAPAPRFMRGSGGAIRIREWRPAPAPPCGPGALGQPAVPGANHFTRKVVEETFVFRRRKPIFYNLKDPKVIVFP